MICGVELKASEAIVVLLERTDTGDVFVDTEPRKIKLGDDESIIHIKSFFDSFQSFVREHKVKTIVIKKRAHKGKMAGGAVSFKMESLIQLNGESTVEFVTGQGIAAAHKRSPFQIPTQLNKYQENAYMAAALYLRKV
jgi:hypothetical protein